MGPAEVMVLGVVVFILQQIKLCVNGVITLRVCYRYVTDDMCFRHVWCLDFKGGLFCTTLPDTGLSWQRFDNSVHQVAVSPSGEFLLLSLLLLIVLYTNA